MSHLVEVRESDMCPGSLELYNHHTNNKYIALSQLRLGPNITAGYYLVHFQGYVFNPTATYKLFSRNEWINIKYPGPNLGNTLCYNGLKDFFDGVPPNTFYAVKISGLRALFIRFKLYLR